MCGMDTSSIEIKQLPVMFVCAKLDVCMCYSKLDVCMCYRSWMFVCAMLLYSDIHMWYLHI